MVPPRSYTFGNSSFSKLSLQALGSSASVQGLVPRRGVIFVPAP